MKEYVLCIQQSDNQFVNLKQSQASVVVTAFMSVEHQTGRAKFKESMYLCQHTYIQRTLSHKECTS